MHSNEEWKGKKWPYSCPTAFKNVTNDALVTKIRVQIAMCFLPWLLPSFKNDCFSNFGYLERQQMFVVCSPTKPTCQPYAYLHLTYTEGPPQYTKVTQETFLGNRLSFQWLTEKPLTMTPKKISPKSAIYLSNKRSRNELTKVANTQAAKIYSICIVIKLFLCSQSMLIPNIIY